MGGDIQRRVVGDAYSGWSSSPTCTEAKVQINQHIRDNRRIRTDDNGPEMRMRHGAKPCKMAEDPTHNFIVLEEANPWNVEPNTNTLETKTIT
jgi:hypothetical protein